MFLCREIGQGKKRLTSVHMQIHINISAGAKHSLSYCEACFSGISELEIVRKSSLTFILTLRRNKSEKEIGISYYQLFWLIKLHNKGNWTWPNYNYTHYALEETFQGSWRACHTNQILLQNKQSKQWVNFSHNGYLLVYTVMISCDSQVASP